MIVASSSHPLLLTKHAAKTTGRSTVGERMKDLLLCVDVVNKTLNLEISRCHLTDYVKELSKNRQSSCSTLIFPHSTNQLLICGVVIAVLIVVS